jgi:hypothetical protein
VLTFGSSTQRVVVQSVFIFNGGKKYSKADGVLYTSSDNVSYTYFYRGKVPLDICKGRFLCNTGILKVSDYFSYLLIPFVLCLA